MAKKKPLTNAERQRNYRERLKASPTTHAVYLEKERQRWQERKEKGKVKSIAELSKKERKKKKVLEKSPKAV